MKKTKILLVGALLLGVPSVALSLSTQQENPTVVRAAEKKITISPTIFNGTSYAANNKEHTIDGLTFKSTSVMLQSNIMQFQKNKGTIQSTTAIEGYITKIDLNISSGTFYVSSGTSILSSATTKVTATYTPSSSSDTFFYIKNGNDLGKLNSITITYSTTNTPITNYYLKYENTNLTNGHFTTSVIKGSDLPTPENTVAQTFEGWYLDSAFTQKIEDTTEITLKEDVVTSIYAKWKDIEYEVTSIADVISKASGTFVIEGEVVGKQNDSSCSVQDSTGAILVYDTTECKKLQTGNTVKIKGTYDTTNNYNPRITSIYIISSINDEKVDTQPITNTNEVIKENTCKYVSLKNLKINGSVSTSGINKTAKVLNENFVLWYTDTSSVKGEEYLTNGAYVNVEGYIQMYKTTVEILVTNITQANTYTITYKSLGGTSVASQTVGEGEKFTKPNDPIKASTEYEEYQFGGWYLDENCSDGKEFNFDNNITSNITVYAKWNVIKKSVSTKFTSVKTQANLGFDYTETITRKEDALANTFVPNKVEAPFSANGYSFSNGLGVLSSTSSYIEFELENDLIDTTEINFSGSTNSNGKIKFVSYDKNRKVIETSTEYILTTEYTHIICELTKYENVKYIRLEVSELSENDKVSISAYQVDTYFTKTTTSYTDFRNITMQFRYEFDTSKFDDISSIGIALTKDTTFSFDQGLEALPENIKLYETKKDNGIDYNTSLTIGVKNIPTTAYDTSLVAVAYVKTTEGKYYFAEKSTYSVNGMVLTYLDTLDKTTEMYKILDAFAATL